MSAFTYVRAASVAAAAAEAKAAGTKLLAGGTDLLGCLRDGVLEANRVVSLSRIAELKKIEPTADGGLRIGAMVTLASIAGNADVVRHYRALADAAGAVGSPQLRNQGTLGGNLCQRPRCWYFRGEFHCLRKGGGECFAILGENQYHCVFGGGSCNIVHPSDTAAALVALDAQFRVEGPRGGRTVPAGSFFVLPKQNILAENVLAPGEVLTHVLLPKPSGATSLYRKVRERASWDFALAGAAIVVERKDGRVTKARIVLSGVAPIPWPAAEAAKVLEGKKLDAALAAAAGEAAVKGAEPMDQNAFKVPLIQGVVEESLLSLA